MSELSKALAKAQGEFPPIEKGRTATVPTKAGGKFSYDYADLGDILAAVRPVLSRNGLAIQHKQKVSRDPLGVETIAVLRHDSGETDIGEPLFLPCSSDMQPTQAIGSAMTYGRRYTTQSILGISTETDDDGNAASGHHAETQPRAVKPQQNLPPCPACGKTNSTIIGKPEYGGGLVCFRNDGCKHKWETAEHPFEGDNPRKPQPPAKPHAGLAAVLMAMGCKQDADKDAVLRFCTGLSLSEARSLPVDKLGDLCEAIGNGIAERMSEREMTRAEAMASIYAEACEIRKETT